MRKISVLMTVYNEPIEWVKKAIESTAPSFLDIEYVVVVDNPKYRDIPKLQQFFEDKKFNNVIQMNTDNLGLVKSLNTAFELSSGDYLARMDADDVSSEGRLMKQLTFLEKEGLDFVAGQVEFMDQDERFMYSLGKQTDLLAGKVCWLEKNINQFWHPTWLMKRQVMVTLNGYRDVPYAEDYDFVARAILSGYKLGMAGEVLLKKRINSATISSQYAWQQRSNAGRIKRSLKRGQEVSIKKFKLVMLSDSELYSKLKKQFSLRKELPIKSLVKFVFEIVGTRPGRALLNDVSVEKFLEKIWI